MELNKYTLQQLEALRLLVAIAHSEYQVDHGKQCKHAKFWADEINQAIADAEFEKERLPY